MTTEPNLWDFADRTDDAPSDRHARDRTRRSAIKRLRASGTG